MEITKENCLKASHDKDLRLLVGEIDNFIVDKCIELREIIGSRDSDLYSGIMCLMIAGNMTTKVIFAAKEDDGADEVLQEFTKNYTDELIKKVEEKMNDPESAQSFIKMIKKLIDKAQEIEND